MADDGGADGDVIMVALITEMMDVVVLMMAVVKVIVI